MRRWSLDQLSVLGVRPAELVEIAARAGYDAISPFIGLGDSGGLPTVPLRAGDPDTLAMARALKDSGLRLNQADGFAITPDLDVEAANRAVDLMAEMGANNIVALLFDPDEARCFDRLAALCDKAESAGIGVVLEFTEISFLHSLADTLQLIERLGRSHVGVLIDLLHLAYAGEVPADIAAVPPGLIRGAQLCDAPAGLDNENYVRVAMGDRMAPGTGELPVVEFLAALPESIIVGIEAPVSEPRDWNERASMLLDCALQIEKRSTARMPPK